MNTTSRLNLVRQAAFGLLLVLATLIGVAALRFALPGQPFAPPLPNLALQREILIAHAVSAGLALMLGPWQFSTRLRARHPRLHRRIGWAYAACLLVGGISGLPLAAQAMGGPVARLGFGLLALAWLATTAIALIHIRAHHIARHRRWMLRSFALTAAGISLRLQLGVAGALGVPVEAIYTAVAWTCWVPNALLAELWLWPPTPVSRRERQSAWPATQTGTDGMPHPWATICALAPAAGAGRMKGNQEMQGHCLCGTVRFTSPDAKGIGACHCGFCRRWGGGPLLAVHCGPNVRFEGEEHIGVYASSEWAERAFCKHCGTHLFYKLLATGEYFVPAGAFETDDFELASQIYIDKKPGYYDFANQTPMLTEQQVIAQYAPPGDATG